MSCRRFLFIEHHPVFGGPHNRAIVLSEPLREHGWDTVAVLPDEVGSAADRYREAGVPLRTLALHRLRRRPRQNAAALIHFAADVGRLRTLMRAEEIDLVVVAGLESPQGVVAGRLEQLPVVWQIIGTRTPMWYRGVMVAIARRLADIVMTTGTTVAAAHPGVEQLGDRWIPFFSPVDTARFTPSTERRALARTELGLSHDALVIGTIGNVNPQKGHDTFIRAAAKLLEADSSLRFVILGEQDANHATYQAALWREARQLGVAPALVVMPPGSRVAELAQALDLFWFTSVSRSEGVPTAVMEAMALGLPTVATDVGGVRDIIQHGDSGLIVPPEAPERLAAATRGLIADEPLRIRLGRNARIFAEARCSVTVSLRTHLEAFERASAYSSARARRCQSVGRFVRAAKGFRRSEELDNSRLTTIMGNTRRRLRRVHKLTKLTRVADYRRPLRLGVAAAVEHEAVAFRDSYLTVIDVGAHHGQFAIFAAHRFSNARIICVEPLTSARDHLFKVIPRDALVLPVAASDVAGTREFHVSRRTDSSSLLPITGNCTTAFPGTEEERLTLVRTVRLDEIIAARDIERPALLKIDVQGSELQVLRGAAGLLETIDTLLVECSFVEFYAGQALIGDVVAEVLTLDFRLAGVYSVVRDARGRCLQADLLFERQ